jgi:uncharacterized Rossmann fold enzyme
MQFDRWQPVYRTIRDDFGFDQAADEAARDLLASLLADDPTADLEAWSLAGETVGIAGAGPSLGTELDVLARADRVIAASDAGAVCRDHGVDVDCLVTDLDGDPGLAAELTAAGTPVCVHAHGDNRGALREWVPQLAPAAVIPTTQVAPIDRVHNVGGFTDGDRAAFLADHAGADRLVFAGWDFDDTDVDAMKRRKLRWAERLLAWLEGLRDERFGVLDGRRDAVDTSMLPEA